jgi:four helix bundle protein
MKTPLSVTLPDLLLLKWVKMFSFEKLEVYKKAFETNKMVYHLLQGNNTIPSYARSQLGRASLSVMLNIAEGCAKFSDRDRRNFYVMARGSAFECASLINFLNSEKEIDDAFKAELTLSFEEISKMLFSMIKNLTLREAAR